MSSNEWLKQQNDIESFKTITAHKNSVERNVT